MPLKTKLLLLVTLSITASVGTVAWLIEEQAHEAFRKVEQERTAALVNQFRREFEHEGDEITHGVETIAGSDALLRTVTELANGAEYSNYVNEAATDAVAQRLAAELPSSNARDYGRPFADIFTSFNYDFYQIDPALFAPAEVWVSSLESGATYHGGAIDMPLLDAQWRGKSPGAAVGAAQP